MADRRRGVATKLRLVLWVARDYWAVKRALSHHPLPEAVAFVGAAPAGARTSLPPARLSHAVDRCLLVGPLRARCLVRAMVLHRMLRRQGFATSVVIGLPTAATSTDAHAWVEIDGRDVGPGPGRSGHLELVRYS